ncbi:EamA-like transporter family protein [Streptoalloteichus tenebrarius]|uniref:EamA-like transporter family protein n=1 Tax=Streptoalloteichus tenebrarius (strain ATCC 17920 / DSM 40477 / JCM 4838 / CBS 697.72 / NBRC 16177 / NCIMB 11028 / NRRL B-12390 / A12253. 1 / ISP 5477) TaxID=1933 RepID=A0ABT1HZ59_STRSD|nr:DMT family transporter [Streptoalloteichus tenebrarius]MCP2260819.1 EamA-like transporter family protein [Streptoalloteichus tenebrarius]BFF00507.1 EamA family transporter [Streptoalloteichus tenebrarius]
MGPVAVSLVVLAAVAHAAWNLFAKRAAGVKGLPFTWLICLVSAVLLLPFAVVAVVVGDGLAGARLGWEAVAAVVATGVLHIGYSLLLQHGYAVGDMSVVYPLARGTGPLLAVTASVLLFDERPGPLGLLGAVAVVLGVLVIGSGTGAAVGGRRRLLGAGYGLLTGVMIAGYTLWDAHAVTTLALSPLIYYCGDNLVRVLLLTPWALRDRPAVVDVWRRHRVAILMIAVLSTLAYGLVLFAMRLAPVSLVAPARELSIVMSALVAWKLLGEPQPGRRLGGALVVLVGVAMLAAA